MISPKILIIHYLAIWFIYMIWTMFWIFGFLDDIEHVEWFVLGVPPLLGISAILFMIHHFN